MRNMSGEELRMVPDTWYPPSLYRRMAVVRQPRPRRRQHRHALGWCVHPAPMLILPVTLAGQLSSVGVHALQNAAGSAQVPLLEVAGG